MRIVFFDLETGGLDKDQHPIVQAAFVATDGLEELDAFQLKIQFDPKRCAPEALKINHYSEEKWEGAAHPDKAAELIAGFLADHATIERKSTVSGKTYKIAQLAGYNAATFDGPFLQAWFKRRGKFLPASYRVLDVMQLAMWTIQSPVGYKLVDMCEAFDVGPFNAHDAMADCRATLELAKKLKAAMHDHAKDGYAVIGKEP